MATLSFPSPAVSARPLPAAVSSGLSPSCFASGGALSVAWREVRADCEILLQGERIEILVPLEGAALRAPLADASGRAREAMLAEPDVALVPPLGRRALVGQRHGALLVLELDPALWADEAQRALGHACEIRECHVESDGFVRGLAAFLCAALRGGAPAAQWLEIVRADLGLHVATRYARPPESAGHPGLAPHRLQRVLAIIDERLAEPIQVRELAEAVHMSPYHFARMFRQSTGHPPHLYVTWQRMDRAKQLLAQSPLPLARVATSVGYQTQAHFTGVFHRRVGMTPRTYRMRCRGAQAGAGPMAQPAVAGRRRG